MYRNYFLNFKFLNRRKVMEKTKKSLFKSGLSVLMVLAIVMSCVSFSGLFASAADEDKIPAKFDNPVIRTDADGNTFFSADPSVRVFDGKLYMYPSHDIFPAQRCDRMDKYHVFSSTNGQDWKDEGEILSAADVKWGEESGFMWAPDCEKIGDKYYFFYPHKLKDGNWQTGVAISDTPVGPFKDLGPIEGTQGAGMIDPNVLVDGDNVYLYWGGAQKLFGGKLTVDGEKVTLSDVKDMTGYCDKFHEGSWVFKKDGKYYMTYASNDENGQIIAYSVGDSPLGEFEYKGTMLSAAVEKNMDTTHGSVVEYKGEWLIFYHNMALSGFECLRSVCADHLTFKEDGTINTVTPAPNTAPPVNKTEPKDAKVYPINDKDWTAGADESVAEDAKPFFNKNNPDNIFVQNMHVAGAYYETKIIDGGDKGGKAKLTFRYSSNTDYAAICVAVNGESFEPAAAAPNGAWEDFTNYASTTVTLKPGMNTLRITGGYGGVNVSAVYVEMLADEPTTEPTTVPTTEPTTQPTTAAPKVDLTVSAINSTPSKITTDDEVQLTAVIRNMSETALDKDATVTFYLNGRPAGSAKLEAGLEAGKTANVKCDKLVKFGLGTRTVAAVVNNTNEIEESDYKNNVLKAKFTSVDPDEPEPDTTEPTTEPTTVPTTEPTTPEPTTVAPSGASYVPAGKVIELNGDDKDGKSSFEITYEDSTPGATESENYTYLGFVTGKEATTDYKYLTITYKGDKDAFKMFRFQVAKTASKFTVPYWFDTKVKHDDYVSLVGKDEGTNEFTFYIDLEKTGAFKDFDAGAEIFGFQLHNTIGNGDFEITYAALSTELKPTVSTGPAEGGDVDA